MCGAEGRGPQPAAGDTASTAFSVYKWDSRSRCPSPEPTLAAGLRVGALLTADTPRTACESAGSGGAGPGAPGNVPCAQLSLSRDVPGCRVTLCPLRQPQRKATQKVQSHLAVRPGPRGAHGRAVRRRIQAWTCSPRPRADGTRRLQCGAPGHCGAGDGGKGASSSVPRWSGPVTVRGQPCRRDRLPPRPLAGGTAGRGW